MHFCIHWSVQYGNQRDDGDRMYHCPDEVLIEQL
jgi:hypothetical protein